jgi:exodeoxyribonuclease V alpha subunit
MSAATEAGPGPAPDGWQQAAELLTACRVPARFAGAAVARLGASAAEQLRADPWLLLSVPQIRPDQADWFARQVLGNDASPQDERRGRALVGYLLARAAQQGNTAVPAGVISDALGRLRIADPAGAIVAAVDGGTVLPFAAADPAAGAEEDNPGPDEPGDGPGDLDTGGTLLALARYAMAEEAVAEGVQRLTALAEPLDLAGADADPELDANQQAAVAAVAEHGVTVLTGGPGTGKSRVLAAVAALAAGRGLQVALAAPTSRSAQQLAGLTGAPATTVPELLGAQPAGGYRHHEDAPLDADLVVVAEAGMLDAELAAALIEACPDGSRLLLAGDQAQLPSAGPGRVLGDLIDSAAVPVTELTQPHPKQASQVIAELAHAVRAGTLPPVDAPDREVVVVRTRSSAEASHRVIQLVTDSIPRALGISGPDIQVITPVRQGPAGITELNQALKQRLNPGPGRHAGFDPGDRVVPLAASPGLGITAGELGTVIGPGDGGLLVEFPGPGGSSDRAKPATGDAPEEVSPRSRFPAGGSGGSSPRAKPATGGAPEGVSPRSRFLAGGSGGSSPPANSVCVPEPLLSGLRHGWALTPQQAQGSEWPAVVAVFPEEAAGTLTRPLVYTTLTRAERHLSVVHGAGPALASAVASAADQPRVTRLAGLLAEAAI